MRVECGLDSREESSLWKADGMAEGGEDAGRAGQMHGYDLDHIDLSVCDGRTVKHGFQDTHPAYTSLQPNARTMISYLAGG